MYYLGIDFGTSFTKVAVYNTSNQEYGVVKLGSTVQRSDGSIPTVAYLFQEKDIIYIGDDAINSRKLPNGEFFENFKPEMASCKKEKRQVLQKILLKFLTHIKECAENQYQQTFDKVVITVPASAPKDGIRYQMMRVAAETIGFSDIMIIPEPVAAAYFLLGDMVHSDEMDESLFLVYDFGGGTFDTSIIKLSEQQIHVIDESVGSDNEQKWGGIYIDSIIRRDYIKRCNLAQHYATIVRNKSNPYKDQLSAAEQLRNEPVKVKKELSKYEEYSIDDYSLSREYFNDMICDMVDETIQCSISLLDLASKDKLCENIHSVKKVFLVGGSSQIPLVYSRWETARKGREASFDIDLKTELNIIAKGASRYRELKLSPKQLNEKGRQKAINGEYAQAAAYFNNADNGEGLFLLGLLYYIGVIGRKRQPAKAYKIFEKSKYPTAYLIMALMRFNNDGVLKDDLKAEELLKKSTSNKKTLSDVVINVIASLMGVNQKNNSDKTPKDVEVEDTFMSLPAIRLRTALGNVLSGEKNSEDLDVIYQFDARTLFNV